MDDFASAPPSKPADNFVALSLFLADLKSIEGIQVELSECVENPPVSSEAEMASDSNCACE
jgi:hypothetical protein